jgi:hypothetical protein
MAVFNVSTENTQCLMVPKHEWPCLGVGLKSVSTHSLRTVFIYLTMLITIKACTIHIGT